LPKQTRHLLAAGMREHCAQRQTRKVGFRSCWIETDIVREHLAKEYGRLEPAWLPAERIAAQS
jgi:hypothetical protein